MNFSSKTLLLFASIAIGLTGMRAYAQSPTVPPPIQLSSGTMELLFTSSLREDGNAEVTLSLAGQNGVEIHQERSVSDRGVISKTILAPVASASHIHLGQTRLILEKEKASDSIVLTLHPHGTPGQRIRLIIPNESTPQTGALSIMQPPGPRPPGEPGGGSGCYPISYTSARCGTITACCPTTSVSIDGVNCTITCN